MLHRTKRQLIEKNIVAPKVARAFLALSFLLTASSADAMSLGKIRVTGSFEKEFRAEIPVRTHSAAPIAVTIGSPDDYKRLDLTRPAFVDHLGVRLADHPTAPGQKIIYLISPEPIDEPSFNLLLKVRQGSGVIMENYFLAVDYQRNLGFAIDEEERAELDQIAMEMAALKVGMVKKPLKKKVKKKKSRAFQEGSQSQLATIRAQAQADDEADRAKAQARRERVNTELALRRESVSPPPQAPTLSPTPKPTVAPPEERQVISKNVAPQTVPAPLPRSVIAPPPAQKIPSITEGVPALSLHPLANRLAITTESYHVQRGNSLYRIAKRMGVRGADRERLITAIWMANQESFQNGNMHLLREGATLNLSRVSQIAAQLERGTAKKIIAEQWRNRRLPASGGSVQFATGEPTHQIPVAKLPFRNQFLYALSVWEHRNGTLLSFKDLRIEKEGAHYRVSAPTKKMGEKPRQITVTVIRDRKGYRVVERAPTPVRRPMAVASKKGLKKKEEEPPSGMATLGHSFVVHVASFKKRGPAREMVKLLRLKGLNAYESHVRTQKKGAWWRVVIGRVGSRERANDLVTAIRKTVTLRSAQVLELPWSVHVDELAEGGGHTLDRLAEKNYTGYRLMIRPGGEALILVGAYGTTADAERGARDLNELGFTATAIKP